MHPDVVLFDLDGTLTESAPGITRSIAYAIDAAGLAPLDDATLLRFVGPPLFDSFRDIAGLDDAGAKGAIDAYREYFIARGMYENSVYPGIFTLLQALVDDGCRLAVATSKPTPQAVPIVEHFGLRGFFEIVQGPETDGLRATKADVLTDVLQAMGIAPGPEVVLVGDRSHDVIGAHAVGIECVGVAWGYGSRDELLSSGADAIVSDVEELADLLGVRDVLPAGN
ncbi:MAG: HAD hydrolase-like protein [Acidothermaceae bacterium]